MLSPRLTYGMGLGLLLWAVAVECNALAAEAAGSKTAPKPYLEWGERRFELAYAAENPDLILREYLPRGQTLDHWTELMAVRVFPNFDKRVGVDGYLAALAADVESSDPHARYAFFQCKHSDQTIIDFMMFGKKPEPFSEWNLMRAEYVDGTGLIVFQYAQRYYYQAMSLDEAKHYAEGIRDHRPKMLELFENADFEEKTP